ncbi:ABC transporter substrate-binding protein [Parvularcula dongshanensis]|uniref:ABC-type sugar transport system substrate-binding protein n=1 Tax=Parvularcula dongshanensis TaxID=1173995 RepID=A0A840I6P1_9PROT|nr:ABC transporter substrate-binding protein [Parvularcula dongshanensis]MBB4659844.1 ABC-type sugar transport system substrate-binding protein [Parvularcula dongshanensis]
MAPAAAQDRPVVALFVVENVPGDPWAHGLGRIGDSVSAELGLDFELVLSGRGRHEASQSMHDRLQSAARLDYAIVVNDRGVAAPALEEFDEAGVKTVLFNAPLTKEEEAALGAPGTKLPTWIAEIIPDDERAGYDLAKLLISQARAKKPEGELRVAGFAGSYLSTVSNARTAGLQRAVAESPDVELVQIVAARWLPEVAAEKFSLLTDRYGRIDIVWAANDGMALGVRHAASAAKQNVLIGGINWSDDAQEAIRRGELAVAMGGHEYDLAYALGLIAEDARGVQSTATRSRTVLVPMTAETIDDLTLFMDEALSDQNRAALTQATMAEVQASNDVPFSIGRLQKRMEIAP